MQEIKRRLARLLVEKSYREGDFVLASGRRSDYYFDCRVTALQAEGAWLIGMLFNDLLKDLAVQGVGGMTMARTRWSRPPLSFPMSRAVRCTGCWCARRPKGTAPVSL